MKIIFIKILKFVCFARLSFQVCCCIPAISFQTSSAVDKIYLLFKYAYFMTLMLGETW